MNQEENNDDSWVNETLLQQSDSIISFGLEMQQPWSQHLLNGRKTIEVRNYSLPDQIVGKDVFIMETKQGVDGKSALESNMDLSLTISKVDPPFKIVGFCRFQRVKIYQTKEEFEKDEVHHLVKPDTGYAWKDGETKVLYGWVVGEVCTETKNFQFRQAVRRKRSLFQLYHTTNS